MVAGVGGGRYYYVESVNGCSMISVCGGRCGVVGARGGWPAC